MRLVPERDQGEPSQCNENIRRQATVLSVLNGSVAGIIKTTNAVTKGLFQASRGRIRTIRMAKTIRAMKA